MEENPKRENTVPTQSSFLNKNRTPAKKIPMKVMRRSKYQEQSKYVRNKKIVKLRKKIQQIMTTMKMTKKKNMTMIL